MAFTVVGASAGRLPLKLIVVSYKGVDRASPRGTRTAAICTELNRRSDEFDLLAGPPMASGPDRHTNILTAGLRRVLARSARFVVLDNYEVWSRRVMLPRLRTIEADGAVLIGFPFSPVGLAAQALLERGIPYVVDI